MTDITTHMVGAHQS